MVGDVPLQKFTARAVVEIDHLDTVFAKPTNATGERPAFPNDDLADVELADEPTAVPARRQSRNHDEVTIALQASGSPERVCFTVDGGITLLNPTIVPAADQLT